MYYLLLTAVLTRNDNSFLELEGCVKMTLIVSRLEWLTSLFLFIMVEFEKVLYSPDLKMVLIFLVTKVFQKGTMFK